jgi:hypothetical protein
MPSRAHIHLAYDHCRCAGVVVAPGMLLSPSLVIILLSYKVPYVEYSPLRVFLVYCPSSDFAFCACIINMLYILVPLLVIALVHVSDCSLHSRETSVSARSASPSTDPAVASTWYAGWHSGDFPPENISWSKYSTVIYAFAYDNRSWYIYCSD